MFPDEKAAGTKILDCMDRRIQIHEKHGIVRLMPPDVANEELSDEDAQKYEYFITYISGVANHTFDRQPKEDRLVELVRLYVSDLTASSWIIRLHFLKNWIKS